MATQGCRVTTEDMDIDEEDVNELHGDAGVSSDPLFFAEIVSTVFSVFRMNASMFHKHSSFKDNRSGIEQCPCRP
jgi:hypothetical protein